VQNEIAPITLDEVLTEKARLSKGALVDSIFGPRRSRSLALHQRQSNKKKRLSRYFGVSRARDKWRMRISFKDREKSQSFDTEEQAARAYDEMARKIWGEQAKLNFPIEREK